MFSFPFLLVFIFSFFTLTGCNTFAYQSEAGQTYHIVITKKGNKLTYSVDGKVFNEWYDPDPLKFGYLGLRTFMTCLWVDNIIVKSA